MVNPVGSCESKHEPKKWKKCKTDLFLTPKQQSFIIGSLLGDATMRVGKGAINANFKIEHGLEQKAYVYSKYDALQNWVLTEPRISTRYDTQGKSYPKSWWFRTVRHPLLTDIYNRFYTGDSYRTGKKIIPKNIGCDLDAQALAVWVMDDGSYTRNSIAISTHSFALADIQVIQKVLQNKFGVVMRYHTDRDKGYRMYCNQSETQKLVRIIYPYIIPSMLYKIGSH